MTDVIDLEAKTRVAVALELPFLPPRNELEQDTVNVELSDNISSQPEAEYIRIERNRTFHIRHIVEDAIEMKSHHNRSSSIKIVLYSI